MQDVDAESRLRLLRGQSPVSHPPEIVSDARGSHSSHERKPRKRRRIAGEDDTDRDIRFAREDYEQAEAQKILLKDGHGPKDMPLLDAKGHVSLFPIEQSQKQTAENPEVKREEDARTKSYEDQYTMRFSNAAGFRQSPSATPWYSSRIPGGDPHGPDRASGKDAWGNESLGRSQREKTRLSANDPLAMMQQGVAELRKSERDRRKWIDERKQELNELEDLDPHERKERKRRRGQGHVSHLSLSGGEAADDQSKQDRHHHHHHHRHRRHRSIPKNAGKASSRS